jgi:cytochrome c biogenesis protein CcmG/thiol:disulfide interchange protein DsbE
MTQSRTETLILMLMAIVILLMVAIAGLFLRMMQLQGQVLAALESFQVVSSPGEGLEVGTRAPNFALNDTEGQTVALADLTGQRVLLAFSSTHCPACKEMYPHLKAFSENPPEIQVVMISRGSAEENRQLMAEQGFDFPVLAWEDAMAGDYQVPGTPFYYAIDGEGIIVSKGFANSLEQLHELVAGAGS